MLNIRLIPAAGFRCSAFGLSLSIANTGPACRNSTSNPTTITGTSSNPVAHSTVSSASHPIAGAENENGCTTASITRSVSATTRCPTRGIARAPSASHTSSVNVLVISLLFGTSPFLRASFSRFSVGFSVLSPPSLLSAMGVLGCSKTRKACPKSAPGHPHP